MAVLIFAGGQPAGPGLPVSISPPGAHHRVGTPILLLLMVPIPAGMEGSYCLHLALSLFRESCLHPSPLHTQGTSLLGVGQAQGGPCSQMLMVVNMGRGDSRSLEQAAGTGFVVKVEHACAKSSSPSLAQISLAYMLTSKYRLCTAALSVKRTSAGGEETPHPC